MTERRFQLLTFDLDNTLWAVDPVIVKAEQATYHWLQQHCPGLTEAFSQDQLRELKSQLLAQRPDLRHQISQLRVESLKTALSLSGYAETDAVAFAAGAFEVFITVRNQVAFFDSAEESLALLSQRYQLAALTNGNACIQRIGIDHYFSFAVSAEAINASKPAPDHFLHALSQSGLSAEQVIHIGDHPEHDIWAAQQLGITTVWVNHQQQPWPEAQPPADGEVHHLAQLPAVIEQLELRAP